MKKIYLVASAVLTITALASCQQGNEINVDSFEKGEVAFSLRGAKATKADAQMAVIKGETIDLGTNENGEHFFLEETITNLDMIAPDTKGIPAYTENVVTLYDGKFNSTVIGSGVNETGEFVYNAEKAKYRRKYSNTLWDSAPLTFYMWMPSALNAAVGVNDLTFDGGKITFEYDGTKLTSATDMQDILFTSRTFSGLGTGNGQYDEKNGSEILFHHALTGVKFAIGNEEKDNVTITKVEFTGLADKGTCVVTPRAETNGYIDDKTGDYSSATVSVWDEDDLDYGGTTFSQEFTGTVDYESQGTGVAKFAESFYSAGNKNNLNDANASQTFWFIPQPMTDDVMLAITYKIGDGEAQTWTIDFGKALAGVKWQAGELRTYTLKVNDVNVKIEDEVTIAGTQANGFTGSYKEGVTITNTGNTDAFIRAALVGQWLNDEGKPVFGFTDQLYNLYTVASWYEDQFVSKSKGNQGTFEDLAGYKDGDNPTNGWYLCEDGYYYYSNPVAPGKETGKLSGENYVVEKLFTKYTIGTAPTVTISGVNTQIHFSLEIATQAVAANEIDGTHMDWQNAWEKALGTTPVIKE